MGFDRRFRDHHRFLMEEDTEILGDFLAFFRLSEIMENVQNRRLTSILSLVSDLLIAGLVLVSIVWLFNGRAGVLRATDASAFKIFTVQSNVFLGLICLILVPFDILMIVEKVEKLRADKRLRFYDVVFAYAFGEGSKPVFDDPELAVVRQQSDVRPYTPGRRGYIKLSQRGGRDGKEQK